MDKSTISMAILHTYMLICQRVTVWFCPSEAVTCFCAPTSSIWCSHGDKNIQKQWHPTCGHVFCSQGQAQDPAQVCMLSELIMGIGPTHGNEVGQGLLSSNKHHHHQWGLSNHGWSSWLDCLTHLQASLHAGRSYFSPFLDPWFGTSYTNLLPKY